MPAITLRLENLSPQCSLGHLEALLAKFGSVAAIEKPLPALWAPFPMGRVEVQMSSEEEAVEAFAHLDGCNLDGCRIRARLVRIDPSFTEDVRGQAGKKRERSPKRGGSGSRGRDRRRSPPRSPSPSASSRSSPPASPSSASSSASSRSSPPESSPSRSPSA